ncbi:MAG: hypothetical protein Q8L47_02060 [bacterium]|nr:hypothetical protein [bacterium]
MRKNSTIQVSDALIVADGYDQLFTVTKIDNSIKKIIKEKDLMFYYKADGLEIRKIYCTNIYVLKTLTMYIQNFLSAKEIIKSIPTHKLSPYVGLLTKNLTRIQADKIAPYLDLEPGFLCNYNHKGIVEISYLLNKIIKNIRIDADSQEFKIALNKYQAELKESLK